MYLSLKKIHTGFTRLKKRDPHVLLNKFIMRHQSYHMYGQNYYPDAVPDEWYICFMMAFWCAGNRVSKKAISSTLLGCWVSKKHFSWYHCGTLNLSVTQDWKNSSERGRNEQVFPKISDISRHIFHRLPIHKPTSTILANRSWRHRNFIPHLPQYLSLFFAYSARKGNSELSTIIELLYSHAQI